MPCACPTARSRARPGSAGNDVFRGDRLPQDMVGDYFYGEVVGAHRPPPAARQDRRPDAAAQRLSAVGVHPLDRSALPAGRHDDGAGRDDVHHGHVPRHHPGVAVVRAGDVPAPADRPVPARQGRAARPHLAAELRRHAAATPTQPRMHAETPAQLVAHLSRSERLVARHGAAVARPQAGQVRRAGAAATGADLVRISWRASMRCGRSRVSGAADAALVRELMASTATRRFASRRSA